MEIFDLTTLAQDGTLQEDFFRQALETLDWTEYRNQDVLIKGCAEIPIPTWAYLAVGVRLAQYARKVFYGEIKNPIPIFEGANRREGTDSSELRKDLTRGSPQKVQVTFNTLGSTVEGFSGETILEIAIDNDISLDHECGGNCQCTTCLVVLEDGIANVSAIESAEADMLLTADNLTEHSRLGCQTRVYGNITVSIPIHNPFKLDYLLREAEFDSRDLSRS